MTDRTHATHRQCHVVTVTFLNGQNDGPITVFCDRWKMFLKRFVAGLNFHIRVTYKLRISNLNRDLKLLKNKRIIIILLNVSHITANERNSNSNKLHRKYLTD